MCLTFCFSQGCSSLLYPVNWEIEENDFLAIYNPQGVGALHISTYQAPDSVDPTVELLEHLAQENPSARLDDVQTSIEGNKIIASVHSVHDGSFQKVWFIGHDSYLVIATYNSDAQDRDQEISEIDEIIRSIEIRPKLSRN